MTQARTRPADPADTAFVVEDLAVARGGRVVVASVSFRLSAGEALAVTGPNGAGKSTLLRALAGLLPVHAGRLALTGGAAEATRAEQLHYLGHADGLKGAMTAAENLTLSAAMLGTASGLSTRVRPSVSGVLARLGLPHVADLPAAYLSAGQRRRVSLARLMIAPRLIWLLDEPMNALDADSREALTAIMAEHLQEGGIVVAATHMPLGLPHAHTLRLAA